MVISQLVRHGSPVTVDVHLVQSVADLILDVGASLGPHLASIWRALAGFVGGIVRPRK